MKLVKYLFVMMLFMNTASIYGQVNVMGIKAKQTVLHKLTIEPGVGLNPMPISDVLISNIVQYNIRPKLNVLSYSSYTFNSAFLRNFNSIHTDYSYAITQKLGVGTSVYSKHTSHTLALLVGVKYIAYKETLDNPEFENVSASIKSFNPDFGLMYTLKIGQKKYFFSYRMYLPLNPYPFKTTDVSAIDGNLANISLEIGLGIRLQ